MTKNELTAKLSNITDISALMTEIENAADDAAVLEVLKAHGLELTAEEVRTLINSEEDELTEDNLEDVTGGCKCKGILKRVVTKALQWLFKTATGIYTECPDCGH